MSDYAKPQQKSGLYIGATELMERAYELGRERQSIEDDCGKEIVEIDGVKMYWDKKVNEYCTIDVPVDDGPVPESLIMFTLDGVVDYIKANVEGLIPEHPIEPLILQVQDSGTVILHSKPSAKEKQRYAIVQCAAHPPFIPFNQYLDSEQFNTVLLSTFVDTKARAEVFKLVKSMTNEQSMSTADDGVSQVITVKEGVSMLANVQFKNPVPLKPMRTFTEIDQPESNFTLRVNKSGQIALFEADGGAWKIEAVKRIKEYLTTKVADCNVVVMA